MKRKWFLSILLLVIVGALLGVVSASALAGYTLDWWTVDSGGDTSSGGSYSLGGTIGQPDPEHPAVAVTPCPAASGAAARRKSTICPCR